MSDNQPDPARATLPGYPDAQALGRQGWSPTQLREASLEALAGYQGTVGTGKLPAGDPVCNINNPFQPRFPHDCRACIFMGQSGKYDTYFCPAEMSGEPGGSVIARSGPDDQYSSLPVSQALLLDMHREARGSDSAATAYIGVARLLLRDGYVGIQINQAEIKRLRDNND